MLLSLLSLSLSLSLSSSSLLSFIIISLHMATIPPRQTSVLSTSEISEIPHSARCVPERPERPGWDETSTEENMRIHHQTMKHQLPYGGSIVMGGTLLRWMSCKGKVQSKMNDLGPYFRKPPYDIWNIYQHLDNFLFFFELLSNCTLNRWDWHWIY